jgi:hypothetical protein
MIVKQAKTTNGLRGKVAALMAELNQTRLGQLTLGEDATPQPVELSLREFLAARYDGMEFEALLSELGIDEHRTTVDDLYADRDNAHLMPEFVLAGMKRGQALSALPGEAALNPVTSNYPTSAINRFLTPEQFFDPIRTSVIKRAYWQQLIARSEPVNSDSPNVPYIDVSDATTREITEGATKAKGTVSSSSKNIKLKKYSTGIGVTYETIRRVSLSWVSLFFEDAGRRHAAKKNNNAVLTIINGDTPDLAYAAAVIGVENTANGFTWFDHIRILVQLEELGFMATAIVASKEMAIVLLNLSEFKNNQNAGSKLAMLSLQSPLPVNFNLFISSKLTASKMAYLDTSVSMIEAFEQALTLESEKIIAKDIFDTYATEWSGFVKFRRDASVIVDQSITFAANPFPSFMVPIED